MRVMPTQGYYVSKDCPKYAIYCTGSTKANMYYDEDSHGPQWNYLLWTCIPGKKDLATNFTYQLEPPSGFPPLSINSLQEMGITTFSY